MKKRIQGSYRNIALLALAFAVVTLISLLQAQGLRDAASYFSIAPVITNIKPDQMEVAWTPFPEFNSKTHYQVEINHALYGSSTKNTSAKLFNLEPGGTYDVAVVTYHNGSVAGVTSYARVMMAPAYPESISVYDIGSASFKIIWQQVKTATSYRVYRFPDIILAEVAEPGNKAEIHGLPVGGNLQIFMTAVNSTGESYKSKAIQVQLLPPPPVISIVEEEIGQTWFSMKWSAVDGAVSYIVYINDTEVASLPASILSYRADKLATGTAVSVKMAAINTSGASEVSEPIIVQLLPATPILAASDVSSYSCKLQWSVANGATYYKVFLDREWCIMNVPSTINQVTLTENITPGMLATYTVKAGNGTGESDHSLPVLVKYAGSSPARIESASAETLNGLLYVMNKRLESNLRGSPLVSVYFPEDLRGPELDLEASYLDNLSGLPEMKKVKFIGVFTREFARIKVKKKSNIIWKIARGKSRDYFLPGDIPLVKFYDSDGWLCKSARLSMLIMTPEDIFRELPEAFEQNAKLIELYREEREQFDQLHENAGLSN
ncbi:MAG: hypothetical protein Kow0029_13230 [Candidatus Rifleibacteriota bacterium]